MSKPTATNSVEILNEVEKVVREYSAGKGKDKDLLKEHLFDSANALFSEMSDCQDLTVLQALRERLDQITDEVEPKELMIIGFYNRFGKVIDEVDARIKEITSSMDLKDVLAHAA